MPRVRHGAMRDETGCHKKCVESAVGGNTGRNVKVGTESITHPRNRKNVLLSTLQRLYPDYSYTVVNNEAGLTMKTVVDHEHQFMIIAGKI